MSSRDCLVASDECVHLQCDIVSKVSSRDYLIASDKSVHLQCDIINVKRVAFESWFTNPPKRTETKGKVSVRLFSSRDGRMKCTETRQG